MYVYMYILAMYLAMGIVQAYAQELLLGFYTNMCR